MKKNFLNILISGGVDSFFSLIILKILKYNIVATHILNYVLYKKNILILLNNISKLINIKIIILDLKNIYVKKIFLIFLKNYNNGIIINPDISCNKKIKFKLILNYLLKKNFSKICTGHYSVISKIGTFNYLLKTSKDFNRDQNYFISFLLNKEKLSNIIFILGKNYKNNLKKIFITLYKKFLFYKPSKGICFLENKNINKVIKNYNYKSIIYLRKKKIKKNIYL